MVSLSISFYVIFSISGWLIQGSNMSKKGYNMIPWTLYRKNTLTPSLLLKHNTSLLTFVITKSVCVCVLMAGVSHTSNFSTPDRYLVI